MKNDSTDAPVMMLTTTPAAHAGRSGYGLLAEHVPGAMVIQAARRDPKGGMGLFFARVARRFAFSRWYESGSASVEWRAWRELRAGFRGVIHMLWTDLDLGFLDLMLDAGRHRLCGTFHNCPGDLPQVIRFPSRLRKFSAIILMSECQRPFFRHAGVADERIHVVLHGVDTAHFTPGAANDAQPFTVISAGGYRRNFPLLRKVCARLGGERGIRFEVVAPADFRAMFEGMEKVRFSSGVSDAELLQKYQSASCLLHTAEQATANNVLVEALACGLPAVAERVGGIPEYVTDECALLAAPNDDAALADAIRSLAISPEQRGAMAEAARRRAAELSWPKVAARMGAIYRGL